MTSAILKKLKKSSSGRTNHPSISIMAKIHRRFESRNVKLVANVRCRNVFSTFERFAFAWTLNLHICIKQMTLQTNVMINVANVFITTSTTNSNISSSFLNSSPQWQKKLSSYFAKIKQGMLTRSIIDIAVIKMYLLRCFMPFDWNFVGNTIVSVRSIVRIVRITLEHWRDVYIKYIWNRHSWGTFESTEAVNINFICSVPGKASMKQSTSAMAKKYVEYGNALDRRPYFQIPTANRLATVPTKTSHGKTPYENPIWSNFSTFDMTSKCKDVAVDKYKTNNICRLSVWPAAISPQWLRESDT